MNLLDLTQSTAVPSPTSILSQPTTVSSTASSTALATSVPSSPSTSTLDARANTLGGGVVGGILGLFVFCGLLYGYFRWRRRLSHNKESLSSQNDMENPASSEVEEPSMTQARVIHFIPPKSSFVSPN